MQKGKFYRAYDSENKSKYIKQGPNDIGKSSIPRKDRCKDFDELWMQTFEEVMKYWNIVGWEEITDIKDITG